MSMAVRLWLAMISLVVATTLMVGWTIYRQATDAAIPLALDAMRSHTALAADEIQNYVEVSREDLTSLVQSPTLRELAERSQQVVSFDAERDAPLQRARVAKLLLAIAGAKPRYDQLRVIGRARNGREVVRVDRRGAGGQLRIVDEAQLQPKADRPYFEQTFAKSPDEYYVSPIDYNREKGVIERPFVPTLRISKPIFSDAGKPQLFLIANLDMRSIFARVSGALPSASTFYIADAAGNYLVNGKDPDRVFGFETGATARIQDDFVELQAAVTSGTPETLKIRGADRLYAVASWPALLAGAQRVTLYEMAPIDDLMASTEAVIARSTLIVGSLAALLATLVAFTIAYRLTRPMRSITQALVDVTRGKPVDLPVREGGEVGALARGVAGYLERESLLTALVSSSVDAVLTKDLEGKITSWNPAAEALYGYTPEEAIGAHLNLVVPPERRDELTDIMQRIAKGERLLAFRTIRVNKAGERLDISLTISPLRNSQGMIIGASTIARDITKALADEQRFQKLQAETAHAARINTAGQMAATLAHELNQPLTAVINYVKSIQRTLQERDEQGDEKVISYAQKAMDQSRRAADIVRKVSTFIGNKQSDVSERHINPIVERGLELALLSSGKHTITVTREYGDDLHPVYVDAVQVEQIVANLVRNAIEAMVSVRNGRLTVTTEGGRKAIIVTIADTGTGLAASVRDHLFEPFTTSKPDGMGFGLNICRSLVEAHGGKLQMEERAEGTIFRFTLPYIRDGLR